jgi:hypothetical protein
MDTAQGQRFKQGMIAGFGATLAGGAISLLALALHVWPSNRPLSVLVLQTVLQNQAGATLPAGWLYLAAGAGQLVYGVLCGGFLGMVADR